MTPNYPVTYPAVYKDAHGEDPATIVNDGKSLRLVVRNVEFTGDDLDGLEPTVGWGHPDVESFPQHWVRGAPADLCDFALEWDMRVPVQVDSTVVEAVLHAQLEIGPPQEKYVADLEKLKLTLHLGGTAYESRGVSGWFDDGMLDLRKMLPPGVFIRTCHSCQYSDYPVAGYGLFGALLCFRDRKSEYLATINKAAFTHVMMDYTERVQETHFCPEFDLRTFAVGYRGIS